MHKPDIYKFLHTKTATAKISLGCALNTPIWHVRSTPLNKSIRVQMATYKMWELKIYVLLKPQN